LLQRRKHREGINQGDGLGNRNRKFSHRREINHVILSEPNRADFIHASLFEGLVKTTRAFVQHPILKKLEDILKRHCFENVAMSSIAPMMWSLNCSRSSAGVVAKIEWHPGELFPRVGFIITNLAISGKHVVAFYNKRGTAEQWIKEGKGAIKWSRLSCRSFNANAVRLQLHALAYNLGNFLRTLATPEAIANWSLSSPREKLIKIGAKVVSHGRYVTFQMAEVAIPRTLFAAIMQRIAALRSPQMATAA